MSYFAKPTERTPLNLEEKVIIRKTLKPVVVYPEKGNNDLFYISYEEVVTDKLDRRKYLKDNAKDVGIMNVVTKLALNKENALDGRFAVKENSFVDLRNMPKDGEEAANLASAKNAIWAKLDPELKKDLSYEEFVKSFDIKAFNDYIASKAGITMTSEEVKGPEVIKKEGE